MSPHFFFFVLTFVLKRWLSKRSGRVYFPNSKSAQRERLKINSGNGLCSVSSLYIRCIFFVIPTWCLWGEGNVQRDPRSGVWWVGWEGPINTWSFSFIAPVQHWNVTSRFKNALFIKKKKEKEKDIYINNKTEVENSSSRTLFLLGVLGTSS